MHVSRIATAASNGIHLSIIAKYPALRDILNYIAFSGRYYIAVGPAGTSFLPRIAAQSAHKPTAR